MTNYTIGDFLIQLKNASTSGKTTVSLKNSKFIKSVAKVLKKEKLLSDVKIKDNILTAKLAFHKKKPLFSDIKLISTPGLRIYKGVKELSEHRGISIFILSTSKGIMSHKDALKAGLGGEVIAQIW